MTINIQKQNEEDLRKKVVAKVFDGYCDERTWDDLVREGISALGLDPAVAKAVISTEMEARCIANEKQLLGELDSLLQRFTGKDRKLDNKERDDAMQYVCKARPGFAKGLNHQLAERYINEYCRAGRIKVKVGLLKWEVPK